MSSRLRLLLRFAVAAALTVTSAFVFDPSMTYVIGGVTGMWVLLGVSAVIHDSARS